MSERRGLVMHGFPALPPGGLNRVLRALNFLIRRRTPQKLIQQARESGGVRLLFFRFALSKDAEKSRPFLRVVHRAHGGDQAFFFAQRLNQPRIPAIAQNFRQQIQRFLVGMIARRRAKTDCAVNLPDLLPRCAQAAGGLRAPNCGRRPARPRPAARRRPAWPRKIFSIWRRMSLTEKSPATDTTDWPAV